MDIADIYMLGHSRIGAAIAASGTRLPSLNMWLESS